MKIGERRPNAEDAVLHVNLAGAESISTQSTTMHCGVLNVRLLSIQTVVLCLMNFRG